MRIAALGRTHWLYDAIELIAARGHDVVMIGTAASAPEYRRHPADFTALAARLGCPGFVASSLRSADVVAHLASSRAEIAISVNWPTLITADTREHFPRGVLNAHAGALPRYRGNACPNWAILNGEPSVGVTIHEMVDELDAGPILAQEHLALSESDYIGDVYTRLDECIPRLFADVIDGLAADTLRAQPQSLDPADALRCHPRRAEDGHIRWTASAAEIARLVRASAEPFAGAQAAFEAERLIVWRARVHRDDTRRVGVPGQIVGVDRAVGSVYILCGDGVLELQELELGGVRGPAAQFLSSTRDRLTSPDVGDLMALQRRVAEMEAHLARVASSGR